MIIINGIAYTEAAAKRVGTFFWVVNQTCKHCGQPFESVSAAACYCSPACKQAAYRQRMKERNAQQRFVMAKGK